MGRSVTPAKLWCRPNGFTLLELLVVLAILSAMLVIAPRMTHDSVGLKLQTAATRLAADLRLLRTEALRRQAPTILMLRSNGYLLYPNLGAFALPNNASAAYAPAAPVLLDQSSATLTFFPDGSSSGGTVTLRIGQEKAIVEISWLDSSIAIHGK